MLLPALVLCLLPRLAAAAAAAGEAVDVESCQSVVWRGLPLAESGVPSAEYNPSARAYYSDWVLRNALPPFVLCCIVAALLAAFLLWRLALLATCLSCVRGPRLRGKAAADLLGARHMRWLRWGVAVLAAGVIGGAGYGFSTIQPNLQPAGIDVYEQTKGYVAESLAQANSTVGAVDEIEGHVALLRQRVLDLNLEHLKPGLLETMDGFHGDIQAASAGMTTAIADVQHSVLGRMQAEQQEWQPRLDKLDVVKNAALYAAYILIICSALTVALGVLLSCPGLVKCFLALLLLMILLAWAAVSATTVGLQVGNDGCMVVEEKVTNSLVSAAERQVKTGEGILSIVGVGDTLALSRYYLYGQGKNATEVLSDLTGLNIPRLLAAANATVVGLQSAALMLDGVNGSVSTLPSNLGKLSGSITQLSANISQLEAVLSYDRFHPLYLTVKQYGCCDLLNFLGGLWLGLLVVGCFGLPLALATFVWLGRMDRLEPCGCCTMYRRSDYAQQQGSVPSVPELPHKKQASPLGDSSDDEVGGASPTVPPTGGSISLRQKFAPPGSWQQRAGAGSGAGAGDLPSGAGAAFRIRTALYPASPHGADESPEMHPDSSPSAPVLPLSARSLPPGRQGDNDSGSRRYSSTWAGAAPPLPLPARGASSLSAPGSTLNTARSSSPAKLPAMEALSPREQAALGEPPSPAGDEGSLPAQQTVPAAGGGSSTSALRRAGNALGRLKFMRKGK